MRGTTWVRSNIVTKGGSKSVLAQLVSDTRMKVPGHHVDAHVMSLQLGTRLLVPCRSSRGCICATYATTKRIDWASSCLSPHRQTKVALL
eukprot:2425530-Amphidinium_carterae.2